MWHVLTVYGISLKSHCSEILFQGPVHATMIQGWLDFEGGVYRDRCTHTRSFNIEPKCIAHIMRVCVHVCRLLLTLYHAVRFLKGGIYWDQLAKVCGGILRTTGFRGAVRFLRKYSNIHVTVSCIHVYN